jgi:thiamine biosynthesis lipoprotein
MASGDVLVNHLPVRKQRDKMLLQKENVASATQQAMGTVMCHRFFGRHAEECLAAVCSEISRLEELLSCFRTQSEISRVNQLAGIGSARVSFETYEVLGKAVEFSRTNHGLFDATIAPLVRLWSESRSALSQPAQAGIQRVLPLVNYEDLILDPREMTAGLRKAGQAIDLGGIGKGFAGSKILEIFTAFDITSAYSNLGGNVVALGTKPDGSAWHIGIQHPRLEDRLIGAVSVADRSVVTSGDYQRCFTDKNGIRHHHILDPLTGYPSRSGLTSVTIVSEDPLAADVLSTTVFIAGMKKGHELLSSYPNTEAIFVDEDMQVFITKGLKGCFQTDEGIRLVILD